MHPRTWTFSVNQLLTYQFCRTHVIFGAADSAGATSVRQPLGQTEICELYVVVLVQKDVLWFQVPVDYSGVM